MTRFQLNERSVDVDAAADTRLVWVIREHLGLTGTKFGCGAGLCGACTVHINGERAHAFVSSLNVRGDR